MRSGRGWVFGFDHQSLFTNHQSPLAQGIEFTEEHALFRFRQFLHHFDAFGDGAHGPKLWHALAVSGKGVEKLGIRAQIRRCQVLNLATKVNTQHA